VDLNYVQVHPTGLVHPDDPNAKVKFLAAEALRGVGGIMLDGDGRRFCNELGTRDYCTAQMYAFPRLVAMLHRFAHLLARFCSRIARAG
jgi:aspartate oxidase